MVRNNQQAFPKSRNPIILFSVYTEQLVNTVILTLLKSTNFNISEDPSHPLGGKKMGILLVLRGIR